MVLKIFELFFHAFDSGLLGLDLSRNPPDMFLQFKCMLTVLVDFLEDYSWLGHCYFILVIED
jgi:hypothetical protein